MKNKVFLNFAVNRNVYKVSAFGAILVFGMNTER